MTKTSISLMPITIASTDVSPWHKIEAVEVVVDPSPIAKEIYKVGTQKVGNKYVDLYALGKKALDKLQQAGGVRDISDECWTKQTAPRIWLGHWSGLYMTPGGLEIKLSDEYEFDGNVGGTRWEERKDNEIEKMIKGDNWRMSQAEVREKFIHLDADMRQDIEARAEYTATRFIRQAAQYGAQRAQTGARDRALRRYFLIGTYPLEVLKNSTFTIIRTRYDFEGMDKSIGASSAQAVRFGLLAKQAGLDMEALARVQRLLTSASVDDPEDAAIEGEVVLAKDLPEDPGDLFEIEATTKTVGKARHMLAEITDAVITMATLWKTVERTIGQKESYTEGEMVIFGMFLEKVKADADAGAKNGELDDAKKTYGAAAKRFIAAGIIPAMDDIQWQQMELTATE